MSEAPPAERRETGDGEGIAAALWGVRTLISWGITAYAVVLLALFAWPFVSEFKVALTFLPIVAIGEPVVLWLEQWLPIIRFGEVNPLPFVLAVILMLLRPRITNPLWRLEARYRARSVSGEVYG